MILQKYMPTYFQYFKAAKVTTCEGHLIKFLKFFSIKFF